MFCTGIIGPESVGKTTLARYLSQRYDGIYIEEYARAYVERLTKPYTQDDVLAIARYQVEQLEQIYAAAENRLYFFDTDLIITKVWLLHKYGTCPKWIDEAIRRYPMDAYLLCYPDLNWQPDSVRENPHIREYLFDWYQREIEATGIPYYIVRHE
mgnify:CR=1 FL=1